MPEFTYSWPRPALTVDALMLKYADNILELLLIKRKDEPFKDCWAFPGGFVDENERVEDALNMLKFAPQKGAGLILKLVNSAVANAQQNSDVDVDRLYIKRIFADEGPMLKRIIPRASGRATRILKRTSHLTVVLNDK